MFLKLTGDTAVGTHTNKKAWNVLLIEAHIMDKTRYQKSYHQVQTELCQSYQILKNVKKIVLNPVLIQFQYLSSDCHLCNQSVLALLYPMQFDRTLNTALLVHTVRLPLL